MGRQEMEPPCPAQRPTRTAESSTRPPVERRASQIRDRRASIERAIELTRWLVLIFAAVTNNFPGATPISSRAAVNLVLGGWGVFNLTATVMLLARRFPGRRVQLATIALDITVASGLVYLTGGFQSDLAIAFYLVVIASSLRCREPGSMLCALINLPPY